MKIKYDMYSQARISITSRLRVNANFPDKPLLDEKGREVYEEDWHEVPFAVALGLENLQNQIADLESRLKLLEPAQASPVMVLPTTGKYKPRKKQNAG